MTLGTISVPNPATPATQRVAAPVKRSRSLMGAVRFWASLKLTVVLFALAILLIFIGTLAQAAMDMWEVISLYFRAWISWIDVSVLFPRSWFPQTPVSAMRMTVAIGFVGGGLAAAAGGLLWRTKVWWWRALLVGVAGAAIGQAVLAIRSGGFWFPGGATIGSLLAVNLLAAHLVRFKLQARGWRLAAGWAVIAAGAVTTWVVISSGHSTDGIQAVPIFSWSALWLWCKLALTGLTLLNIGMLVAMLAAGSRRIIELVLTVLSGVLLCGLTAWLWLAGDGAYLGDAGMRILWQLIQGGLAAAVILAGCILLFKRRGGLVLIHVGLALMMLGEWFVSWFAAEERMMIREGGSANFALDIRETELAIINRDYSPTEEDVMAIPRSALLHSVQRGERVRDPSLPFDVRVVSYLKNSDLRRVKPSQDNPATAGQGLTWRAEAARPNSGADASGQVDMASAYIELTDKTDGKTLGTRLVSQFLDPQQHAESVAVGDKTYDLALRFKQTYKPYTIQLIDVRKDDYIGTSTPKNYSSDVRLIDPTRNVDRHVRIWMNNPLRYAGETFYQSGYNADPRSGVETTTLQVVTNTGWMIPYVACMFVWFGMQTHFGGMLLRFLTRRDAELFPTQTTEPSSTDPVSPAGESRARRERRHGRRAASRDASRARSGAVIFPSAIVLLFGGWLASQARPPRPPENDFDYALFGSIPVVDQGRVKPLDTLARTNLAKVSDRETYVDAAGGRQPAVRWFLDIVARPDAAEQDRVFRIQNLEVLQMLGLERRPGFRYALGEIRSQPAKLAEFDKELRATRETDTTQLSTYQRKLIELNNRFQTYLRLVNAFQPWDLPPIPSQAKSGEERSAALRTWISQVITGGEQAEQEMASIQAPLAVPLLPSTDSGGADGRAHGAADRQWHAYATAYNRAFLQQMLGRTPNAAAMAWHGIFDAYRKNDARAFNGQVRDYLRLLKATPPEEYVPRKVVLEAYLNAFDPYTLCIGLYWTAFVLAACAWLGWSRPLNRAAFWLVFLAFCVHTIGLLGRIYISGRPPVTNLYSSAIFIAWCFALAGLALEAIFRLGICNVVAAVGGALTLMVAQGLGAGADTFTVMQAVLDTQFWLATHVVFITLGYAATFNAGLLGIIYIVMGVFTRALAASETQKLLARMIYGVICFAALFSFAGTVLGGLWADDSWGRFWGWDPKENGALIIVLWSALILHALWDRMIGDRGLAVMAVAGNIVTAWSWFGVNELGVGLHSYGFTEGVLLTLGAFVASQLGIMAIGMMPLSWWNSFRRARTPALA